MIPYKFLELLASWFFPDTASKGWEELQFHLVPAARLGKLRPREGFSLI